MRKIDIWVWLVAVGMVLILVAVTVVGAIAGGWRPEMGSDDQEEQVCWFGDDCQ